MYGSAKAYLITRSNIYLRPCLLENEGEFSKRIHALHVLHALHVFILRPSSKSGPCL